MILNYLNEKETPYLNQMDRLTVILYLLGIATKRQISIVTGWGEKKVEETLARIRKQGKTPKEKDEWLQFWQIAPGQPYIYTLGQKGLEHALAIRREPTGNGRKKKKPHLKSQAGHFLGFNDILCRLIEHKVPFETFMVSKEVMQNLRFTLKKRSIDTRGFMTAQQPKYLPFRPDGLVTMTNGKTYYLEYDTGTETTVRLSERLERYLEAYTNLDGDTYPVVWVTVTENRKGVIERCAARIRAKFDRSYRKPVYPTMYCFVEGQETEFLAGKCSATPFWSMDEE